MSFKDELGNFSPVNFYQMVNVFMREAEEGEPEVKYNIQQLLSVLKLSEFDPYVFYRLRHRFLELALDLYESEKVELQKALMKIYANFFKLCSEDVLFELAGVAYNAVSES